MELRKGAVELEGVMECSFPCLWKCFCFTSPTTQQNPTPFRKMEATKCGAHEPRNRDK